MEKLKEILEKYFRGETTLAEENELKKYFASGKTDPEFEPYRPIFEAFNMEANEKMKASDIDFVPEKKTYRHMWIQTMAYSGIAAALVISLWIIKPSQNDDYAIIKGKKIENAGFAQEIAKSKFQNVNKLLARSLQPMHTIDNVRSSLEPMNSLAETKQKMKKIHNLLNNK